MRRLSFLFIVNPVAGKGNGDKIIPLIEEVMKEYHCTYEIRKTEKVGEGKRIAEEARHTDFSTIVSVGGDGTLHEVINGMVGSKQKLGIIPAGTGNDFARTLNLPRDIRESIESLVKGNSMMIDLGKINKEYFINISSIGLDALIADETNRIKKYFSSTYSYVIGTIKSLINFKSFKTKLVIDDAIYEEEIMLAAVCNGSYYGGGMKISPKSSFSDGEFDICIVRKMPKLKLLFLLPTIFKGNHVKFKEVKFYKGKNIEFLMENGKKKEKINADGEILDLYPIQFEMINNAIEVVIP